jgi:hypothetical protein
VDGGVYHPVVVFRTADGQQVRTETPSGSYPPPARVGERVEVIYDPANPRNLALYPLRKSETVLPVVMVVVGAAVIAYVIFQISR